MHKFHHLGIFVPDLSLGKKVLSGLINIQEVGNVIKDRPLRVCVQFMTDASGLRYELVAPLGPDNPVDAVLDAKKNILNHVAYMSDHFERDCQKMRREGCVPLAPPRPAQAFNGQHVMFFLTPLHFVLELIEAE